MSLADFLAEPSGRFILDRFGAKAVAFGGIPAGETHKRLLLSAVHLRPLVEAFEDSRAGRSPIPAEHYLPAIRAGLAYLGRLPPTDAQALAITRWHLEGDAIRENDDVIGIVMGPAPEGLARLIATVPQTCAAAMQILEVGMALDQESPNVAA